MIWGDEVSILFTNDALSFHLYFSFFLGFFPENQNQKKKILMI